MNNNYPVNPANPCVWGLVACGAALWLTHHAIRSRQLDDIGQAALSLAWRYAEEVADVVDNLWEAE